MANIENLKLDDLKYDEKTPDEILRAIVDKINECVDRANEFDYFYKMKQDDFK